MPNFLDKSLKHLDMYGQPILFTYRNSTLFTSTCGVVVSLAVIFLILLYGILLILDIMAYDKPKLLELTQTNLDSDMMSYMIPDFSGYFNLDMPQLVIPKENSANTAILQISVALEDYKTFKFVPLDPKYFYLSFNNYQKIVTSKNTTITEDPLFFDYCTRFPYATNTTFKSYLMYRSLCLYSPFILKGDSSSNDFRKLNIQLNFCQNDTLGYYNKIVSNEYKRVNFLAKRWVEKNNKNFSQYYLSLDKLTALDLINYPVVVNNTANTTSTKGGFTMNNNTNTSKNSTINNCTSNSTNCKNNTNNSTNDLEGNQGNSTFDNNTTNSNSSNVMENTTDKNITNQNNTNLTNNSNSTTNSNGNSTTSNNLDDANSTDSSTNNTTSSTTPTSPTSTTTPTAPTTPTSTTTTTTPTSSTTTTPTTPTSSTTTTTPTSGTTTPTPTSSTTTTTPTTKTDTDDAERTNMKPRLVNVLEENSNIMSPERLLQISSQISNDQPKNTTSPIIEVQQKYSAEDLLFMSIIPHVDLLRKLVNLTELNATSLSNTTNNSSNSTTNTSKTNSTSSNTNSTSSANQINSNSNSSNLNATSNSINQTNSKGTTPTILFNSKVVCASQSDIFNKIKSTRLVFFFTSADFNSTNLKSPISTRVDYVYIYPSFTIKKNVDTYFSMDRAVSYSSIIPPSMLPFNQDNKNYIPNYSVNVDNTAYSDVDLSQPFLRIEIKYSRTRKDYQRNYRDIFEIMGLVGGISKIVMLLGFFAVFYVVNLKLKESLINEFYLVIDPDKLTEVNKDFESFLKQKYEHLDKDQNAVEENEKNIKSNEKNEKNLLDLYFNDELVYEIINSEKNSNKYKKYEIVYEVFKHQVHSKLRFSFTEILANMFCFCCLTKRMRIKNMTFRKAWNKLIEDTDFITILKSVQEFKSLKQALLDEAQHDLFSSIKNEEIKVYKKIPKEDDEEEGGKFVLKKANTLKEVINTNVDLFDNLRENLDKISNESRKMDEFDIKLMKNLVERKKIISEFLGEKYPRKNTYNFDEADMEENFEKKSAEPMKNEDFRKITNIFYKK